MRKSYSSDERSTPSKATPNFENPYDYFTRRQRSPSGSKFVYGIALSNLNWGPKTGAPEATAEEVGFGFLMCALKFPMHYPSVPESTELWMRFLPVYKEVVKPDTTAFVWVKIGRAHV